MDRYFFQPSGPSLPVSLLATRHKCRANGWRQWSAQPEQVLRSRSLLLSFQPANAPRAPGGQSPLINVGANGIFTTYAKTPVVLNHWGSLLSIFLDRNRLKEILERQNHTETYNMLANCLAS